MLVEQSPGGILPDGDCGVTKEWCRVESALRQGPQPADCANDMARLSIEYGKPPIQMYHNLYRTKSDLTVQGCVIDIF
jgi:hypothetical protein